MEEQEAIHPFLRLKRKRKHLSSDVAQCVMGVSALLSHARKTMKLDDGDHDVRETPAGNIHVDGEPLTFESWSKFSGSDDKVVSCKNQDQFTNIVQLQPSIMTIEEAPKYLKRRNVSEEGECSSSENYSTSSDEFDSD